MKFARAVVVGLSSLALVVACSGKVLPARGGVMVSIESDGVVDADYFNVQVSSGEAILFQNQFNLPETPLPSTVSIVSNGIPTTTAKVIVSAYKRNVDPNVPSAAVDRRDAIITQIPSDRLVALVLRLSVKCKELVRLGANNEAESTCPVDQTCSPESGTCVSSVIDASQLPDWGSPNTQDRDGGGPGNVPGTLPDGGTASSCPGKDGPVAVGASEDCNETEDGKPVTFTLENDPRGICKRGRKICTGSGKFDRCVGVVAAKTRNCTSQDDNDCNGVADNPECTGCQKGDTTEAKIGDTESCFPFPLPAKPVGPCKSGLKTCQATADKKSLEWSSCGGAVGPTTAKDSCLTATSDDNCNGTPIEDCPCTVGQTKVCGNCGGTVVTCTATGWPACPPSSLNLYNGRAVGQTCSGGTGACYRAGTVVCPAGGGNATCSSLPAAPSARNCTSSADNDCNGIADNAEGLCRCDGVYSPGFATQSGCESPCGNGTRTCTSYGSSAAFAGCVGRRAPPPNLNQACGSCGGVYDCNGNCTKSTPTDLGREYEYRSPGYYEEYSCCFINYNRDFGGTCDPGFRYSRRTMERISGGGLCTWNYDGGNTSCWVGAHFENQGLEGARCRAHIYQVRVCDP